MEEHIKPLRATRLYNKESGYIYDILNVIEIDWLPFQAVA